MALITIKVVVPNIAEVLAAYDQIKVYRSPSGDPGTFAEITTAPTRVPLVTGQSVYSYIDGSGASTYWYETSYFNSLTLLESDPSAPAQGESGTALTLLSVEELRDLYLFGVDLTDNEGRPFPDIIFQHNIQAAVDWTEKMTDLPLVPQRYVERQDFIAGDYYRWSRLQVDHAPVLSVSRVSLILTDNTTRTVDFDPSWTRADLEHGWINLVPAAGGSLIVMGTPPFVPPLGAYGWPDQIPQAFEVEYVAGFAKLPPMLKDIIGKQAAIGVLNIAGDLVNGAGIAERQLLLDGTMSRVKTTQSPTNAGYGARILQYKREVAEAVRQVRLYYRGIGAETG